MVKKETLVYLFIGQDSLSKDIKLKKLKEEFLTKDTEYFNFDTLYAKELNLTGLQERLLSLPLKAKKRIVLLRNSQNLREDIKEFLIKYVKNPQPKIVLILDIDKYPTNDTFIRQAIRYSQALRFNEPVRLDTFALSRSIDLRKTSHSLWVLNQLLSNGERPERILGGLRYAWENRIADSGQTRKKLRLLLNCDIDIKTGRLKPDFALERVIISLCCLAKPSG